MKFAYATEKWTTGDTIGSDAHGVGTSADQGEILEIGPSCPVEELTFTHRRMLPLSTIVEQVLQRSAEPHSFIPIGELPPLVLEPNRRKVESEEEVEEPTSPLLVNGGRKLARAVRSLSMKSGY
jgi:hypothetical protein